MPPTPPKPKPPTPTPPMRAKLIARSGFGLQIYQGHRPEGWWIIGQHPFDREMRWRGYRMPSKPLFAELIHTKSRPLVGENYVLEWTVMIYCADGQQIEAKLFDEFRSFGQSGLIIRDVQWFDNDQGYFIKDLPFLLIYDARKENE